MGLPCETPSTCCLCIILSPSNILENRWPAYTVTAMINTSRIGQLQASPYPAVSSFPTSFLLSPSDELNIAPAGRWQSVLYLKERVTTPCVFPTEVPSTPVFCLVCPCLLLSPHCFLFSKSGFSPLPVVVWRRTSRDTLTNSSLIVFTPSSTPPRFLRFLRFLLVRFCSSPVSTDGSLQSGCQSSSVELRLWCHAITSSGGAPRNRHVEGCKSNR